MTISMYEASIPVFIRMLTNCDHVLDKGLAHAEAKKVDPGVFVQMRLYPDMLPLARQVQIASDMAKGCAARLAGQEPPKYEDTETTFPELKARVAKTIAFLRTFRPDQIDGTEEHRTDLRAQDVDLPGFTVSLVFRAAQLLFSPHDRLRYPAPWGRRDREDGFHRGAVGAEREHLRFDLLWGSAPLRTYSRR